MSRCLAFAVGLGLVGLGMTLPMTAPAVWSQSGLVAPEFASDWHERPLATAKRFMVAAANPLAANAGLEMMRAGGSAIDAAIATQLVLGLVEPQSSGLGGGAFLLYWDAERRRLASYDGRETAPAAARPDRFLIKHRPMAFKAAVKSALSVGVPGTVRLLEEMHRRHGRLAWRRLFQPAIALSEAGFKISPRLAKLLSHEDPASFALMARDLYFDVRGRPRAAGYLLRNPAYANTLRAIAEGGANAFYSGPLAAQIVAAATATPFDKGSLALSDLASYRVVERPAVCVPYRRYKVCSMGPPSSGAHTIGQTLSLLAPLTLGTRPAAAMSPPAIHLMAEAEKLAFADRNRYLADPSFVPIPPGLLDPGYLAERRSLMSPFRSLAKTFPGTPPGRNRQALGADETHEAAGTSHISIVDAAGNAVSMTTTIEAAFGSGLFVGGFLLNNELTDFSFRPVARDGREIANRVEGGKRPRSSMSPTIVLGPDGSPAIVTGSAGGSRIIPYVLKILVAVIDWKLNAAQAVALPNFGSRGNGFELELPSVGGLAGLRHPAGAIGIISDALNLKPLGQHVTFETQTSGTQVIVRRADGSLEGAADPRREGMAVGD